MCFFNSVWPNYAMFYREISVNIGSGNGLLPDGTKTLHATNVDLSSVKSCDTNLMVLSYEYLKISIFLNRIQISQGTMS